MWAPSPPMVTSCVSLARNTSGCSTSSIRGPGSRRGPIEAKGPRQAAVLQYNFRMAISGIQAFLDLLAGFGVRQIFGNPGTTEMPLNDALVGDRRFQYILGLQEVPVMAMADGFAMASGQLGFVNLHISCGLGNAMGMLYNAYREGTPLL